MVGSHWGMKMGRSISGALKIFSEYTPYGTIMIDTCSYEFIQTHKIWNIKSEL